MGKAYKSVDNSTIIRHLLSELELVKNEVPLYLESDKSRTPLDEREFLEVKERIEHQIRSTFTLDKIID